MSNDEVHADMSESDGDGSATRVNLGRAADQNLPIGLLQNRRRDLRGGRARKCRGDHATAAEGGIQAAIGVEAGGHEVLAAAGEFRVAHDDDLAVGLEGQELLAMMV